MPLIEAEKVKIRMHLGYLCVADAYTFVLGTPAAVETQFIIEGAMVRVLESALSEVRRHIQVLDTIHEQKINDLELLAVNKVGEIDVRNDEQSALDKQYEYWQGSLANLLGILVNPFDKRLGNGINISVINS